MKPSPIDLKTNQPLVWDNEFRAKIPASQLLAILDRKAIGARDAGRILRHFELEDKNGNFSIRLNVVAMMPQEDGTCHVYGGAGTDEHYGSWCIVFPNQLAEQDGDIETAAYFAFRAKGLRFEVEC